MRKITIGRGHECNVIVDDKTDVVSRRQAIITFTFFGRMSIYDLSTNGTFINGHPVPKPEGCRLRRSDHIRFGSTYDFDLSKVKNPYRKIKATLIALFVLVILGGAGFAGYYYYGDIIDNLFDSPRSGSSSDASEPAELFNRDEAADTVRVNNNGRVDDTDGATGAQTPAAPAKKAAPAGKTTPKKSTVRTHKNDTKPADDTYTPPAEVEDLSNEKI